MTAQYSGKQGNKAQPDKSDIFDIQLCNENVYSWKHCHSGLNLSLKTTYNRQGEDGLYNVFLMTNSLGQARVTNVKKTLKSVIPKLAKFLEQYDNAS